jgi:hypothetical protein
MTASFHVYFQVTAYNHPTIWHNVANAVKMRYEITHELTYVFYGLVFRLFKDVPTNVTWKMIMNGEHVWVWKEGVAA